MLFNSLDFVLMFLPLAMVSFYALARLKDHRWAQAGLIAFSLFFYMWWNPKFAFLVSGSAAFNYACGVLILKWRDKEERQKLLLFGSIAANILLLFGFKYLVPTAQMLRDIGLNLSLAEADIVLPLGISFFTFTQIGYLVDCQAGLVKRNEPLDFFLFVTFFPHLIAGPILHHKEMIPQFADRSTYRFQGKNIAVGLTIFFMGLFKKTMLADHFVDLVKDTYDNVGNLSSGAAWCGVLSYSLQLYFDFSGYSDMAIGLAQLFNLRFPANFNSPYKSASIIDYWQRWNMTLTRYIMLYIYTPIALHVSRSRMARGLSVSKDAIKHLDGFAGLILFPTFITFALAGLWHGAGWTFLIYGLIHAIYISVNHAWRIWKPAASAKPLFPPVLAHGFWVLVTCIAIVVSQVFFRSSSVLQAINMLGDMLGLGNMSYIAVAPIPVNPDYQFGLFDLLHLYFLKYQVILGIAAGVLFVWIAPNTLEIMNRFEPTLSKIANAPRWLQWKPNFSWGILVGVVAAFAVLAIGGTTEFLYFRF